MDTVQYLANDWNNRNKIRSRDKAFWLTVPIDKKRSSNTNINQVFIGGTEQFGSRQHWQTKHWKSLELNYKRAPFFSNYEEELRDIYLGQEWHNLVELCWIQFSFFRRSLLLPTKKILRMSESFFQGKKDGLILDQCQRTCADKVVLGIHGRDYLDVDKFTRNGISVYFQDYDHPVYDQAFDQFIPNLSVLDLLFNHGESSLSVLVSGNIRYQDLVDGDYWINSSRANKNIGRL